MLMPRIRCHYTDCVFIDDGYCSAAAVEIDPDTGCATYSPTDEAAAEENWEEDEELEEWEDEEEEEDENWEEEEDEF
jgi:hypothetical protein